MNKLVKLLLISGTILFTAVSYAMDNSSLPVFNAQSLKQYDGKNGHKAYVALNGYVYDVSNIPQWQGGRHYKGMVAGTDLSSNISKSPHGPGIVKQLGLSPVGIYK